MTKANDKLHSVVQNVTRKGEIVFVELAGDIDMHRSMDLRESLLEVMGQKPPVTLIDMTQVSFMDSSGLATLVEALQLAHRFEGQLKLVGVQKRVRSIFEISRLDSIFPMYESQGEALAK